MPRSSLYLVCEGDSLTSGTGASTGNDWPHQLAKLFTDNRMVSVVNVGKSGDKISDITTEASAEVDTCYDSRKPLNVENVLIGTNSLAKGETGDFTGATSYGLLKTYCLARQAAGFKIVVCTIPPATQGVNIPVSFATEQPIYNASIRSGWATFANALADIAADSRLSDSTNATYFNADGIHLTDAGYAIVAATVKAALDAIT